MLVTVWNSIECIRFLKMYNDSFKQVHKYLQLTKSSFWIKLNYLFLFILTNTICLCRNFYSFIFHTYGYQYFNFVNLNTYSFILYDLITANDKMFSQILLWIFSILEFSFKKIKTIMFANGNSTYYLYMTHAWR